MKKIIYSFSISTLIILSCNNGKKVEKPNFTGNYTVVTKSSYAFPGQDNIQKSEIEHLNIEYVGGDTIKLSSETIFSKPALAKFNDTKFDIIPYDAHGAKVTGNGNVLQNDISLDIIWDGFASATFNLKGQKENTKIESNNLDTAMVIAKKIIDNVEKAENKIITKAQLDKETQPLQKTLDSLRQHLTPVEIQQLDDYRTSLVNKIVDRKIENNK